MIWGKRRLSCLEGKRRLCPTRDDSLDRQVVWSQGSKRQTVRNRDRQTDRETERQGTPGPGRALSFSHRKLLSQFYTVTLRTKAKRLQLCLT